MKHQKLEVEQSHHHLLETQWFEVDFNEFDCDGVEVGMLIINMMYGDVQGSTFQA